MNSGSRVECGIAAPCTEDADPEASAVSRVRSQRLNPVILEKRTTAVCEIDPSEIAEAQKVRQLEGRAPAFRLFGREKDGCCLQRENDCRTE